MRFEVKKIAETKTKPDNNIVMKMALKNIEDDAVTMTISFDDDSDFELLDANVGDIFEILRVEKQSTLENIDGLVSR